MCRTENKLKLVASGDGDLSEMVDELGEGKVQYAFIRFKVSEGYKFVYVAWCGEGVTGMLRGNFANHATDFENFLTQNQLGFHVRINARSENDLQEVDIVKKINAAKGANFVKAGTKKEGTGPDLKQVSKGFWDKQSQIDQQHSAQMSSHEKAKVDKLEQSKQEEAARMKQRADAELAQRDQYRNSVAQQRIESEAQKAQLFEGHRAKELQRVTQYQEQSRAAAPRAGIGAASAERADAPAHNRFKPAEPAPSQRQDEKWAPPARGAGAPARAAFGGGGGGGGAPPPSRGPPAVAAKPAPAPAPEPEPAPVEESWGGGGDAGGGDAGGGDAGWGGDAGGDAGGGYSTEPPAQQQEEWGGGGGGDEQPGYSGGGYGGGEEQPGYSGGGGDAGGGGQYVGTCTAQFDFPGENEGDLPFREGDVINVINNDDAEGWWEGELNGVRGFYPSNFTTGFVPF